MGEMRSRLGRDTRGNLWYRRLAGGPASRRTVGLLIELWLITDWGTLRTPPRPTSLRPTSRAEPSPIATGGSGDPRLPGRRLGRLASSALSRRWGSNGARRIGYRET